MTVTRTHTFVDGDTLTASQLNNEFNNLLNAPAIVNADISAGAAIAGSKLANPLTSVTLSAPTISGTVGGSGTYTKPTFNGSVQAFDTYTPGAGGTATLDLSAANVHSITMPAGNITIALTSPAGGQTFVVIIQQDGVGSRTVTWFAGIKWVGASAPTLTTTASRWDIFTFFYDGTNYYGAIVGQNFG